jgi:hypothetical protein
VTSYAVKWREPDGQTFIGRLALGPGELRLEGRRRGADSAAVNRRLAYKELWGLRIGSHGADRLDGRPALVLQRPDGTYLVAGAGLGAPIVHEVFDRLAGLRLDDRAVESLRLTRNRAVLRP